jgi:phosphinothricin acetyltransferase
MSGPAVLRPMTREDWSRVEEIYAAGIATRNATFETTVPSWERWDAGHLSSPRLVAEVDGALVGWAALSPASTRPVYAGVAEVSVYVDPASNRRGIGTSLLDALARGAEDAGLWTLKATIFPENPASLRIHEKCGFRVVGTHRRLARMAGRGWRDVVLMERRSERVGRD